LRVALKKLVKVVDSIPSILLLLAIRLVKDIADKAKADKYK
jgi:hypothetical protein